MHKLFIFFFLFLGLLNSQIAFSKSVDLPGRIPDEYESSGGHSLGFSSGGMSAVSGQSSIRSNPAMLIFEKKYEVTAGYNWPSVGRQYYQAGVIDSQTSAVAAGFTFTSFRERFRDPNEITDKDDKYQAFYDSPLKSRLSLAIAKAFGNVGTGFGVQVVNSALEEGKDGKKGKKRGVTFGFGLAGLLTPSLRIGASAENLGNRDVKDLAPIAYRGGLAYLMLNGDLTVHLDYRQRERVLSELTTLDPSGGSVLASGFNNYEKMAILSSSVRIQDLLRILGGYGMEVGGKRSTLSGGVALVNKTFSFSYLIGKQYMKDSSLHQAVNLEFQLSF